MPGTGQHTGMLSAGPHGAGGKNSHQTVPDISLPPSPQRKGLILDYSSQRRISPSSERAVADIQCKMQPFPSLTEGTTAGRCRISSCTPHLGQDQLLHRGVPQVQRGAQPQRQKEVRCTWGLQTGLWLLPLHPGLCQRTWGCLPRVAGTDMERPPRQIMSWTHCTARTSLSLYSNPMYPKAPAPPD